MVSKLSLAFLLLVFLSILSQPTISTVVQTNHHDHGLNVGMISSALSDKGYIAVSLILEQTLPTIPKSPYSAHLIRLSRFPSTRSHHSPSSQYHVAQLKLDREALQSTVPYESKFDTLLPHHPLVVTRTPHHSDRTSINGVKVTYWDIYNDRCVIMHEVKDFFNPTFQTLLYPWYDGMVTKNENESRTGKDSNTKFGRLSWVKEMMMMELRFFLVMAVLVLARSCLSVACLRCWNYQDGGYAYSKSDDSVLV